MSDRRQKRRDLLKKTFICAIFAAIVIPTALSAFVLLQLRELGRRMGGFEERLLAHESVLMGMAAADEGSDSGESVETSVFFTAPLEESLRSGSGVAGELQGAESAPADFYLTFDDGPSANTDRILDILSEYDVKATFFVVGKTDEQSKAAYRRIVAEGHTLGMHSYSHRYQEIYRSVDDFAADLTRLQEYLYEETGVWSRYYRFPGGSSNTVSGIDMRELTDYLTGQDIIYFDWNIASGDAASGGISRQRIVANCLSGAVGMNEGMILLHDAAGKDSTVAALAEIIEGIRGDGQGRFLPISGDTPPIRHIN